MRKFSVLVVTLLWSVSVCAQGVVQAPKGEPPVFVQTCPVDAEFGQLPLNPFETPQFTAAESSDNIVVHFESFSGLTGPIVSMRWWGTYFDDSFVTGPGPCTRTGITFVVKFYEDNAGAPGREVESLSGVLAPVNAYEEDGQQYLRFNAALDPPIALENGWVSVQGRTRDTSTEAQCNFYWVRSGDGNGSSVRRLVETGATSTANYDLAMCLVTDPDLVVEGEGEGDGEGQPEGEGEGEGANEGEPEGEGEGADEGEGEGEEVTIDDFLLRSLLQAFRTIDTGGDLRLTLAEIAAVLPELTPAEFELLDANGDGAVSVWELLEYRGEGILHRADINADLKISLSEVLRLVQFHNAGAYACVLASEDGYEPDVLKGGLLNCSLHTADTDANSSISLSELMRVIQLYNAGGYFDCEQETEDGFCLGIAG
jgi:Ca2+-binding EF-hand superfamily protein